MPRGRWSGERVVSNGYYAWCKRAQVDEGLLSEIHITAPMGSVGDAYDMRSRTRSLPRPRRSC